MGRTNRGSIPPREVCQKRTGDADIDMVDQHQILAPFGALDFIGATGVDLSERPTLKAPRDDIGSRLLCSNDTELASEDGPIIQGPCTGSA